MCIERLKLADIYVYTIDDNIFDEYTHMQSERKLGIYAFAKHKSHIIRIS